MTTATDKRIAKQFGVTPVGLAVLAKAASSPDGVFRGGLASGNPGSAKGPLADKGFLILGSRDNDYQTAITDAGREIVRRARQMGW